MLPGGFALREIPKAQWRLEGWYWGKSLRVLNADSADFADYAVKSERKKGWNYTADSEAETFGCRRLTGKSCL